MKKILFFFITLILVIINLALTATNQESPKLKVVNPKTLTTRPSFPGGDKAWRKFLSKNLKWPKGEEGTNGREIISFIVEADGRLTNIKIMRSLGKNFDIEVLRIMKLSPNWIPAKQNGKSVGTKYYIPISFQKVL